MNFFSSALSGIFFIASTTVLAQTPQPPAMPLGNGSSVSTNYSQTTASSQAEQSLEGLANRLKLNDQQLQLWNKFASRVNAWEQNLYKERPVWSADANVLAEIGHLTLNQQNRLSLLEDLEASIRVLYNGLNEDQKQMINTSLLQSIPGLLPNVRRDSPDGESRRESGRIGSGGSGRRRSGGMGGFGGMN